jgi:proteasome lid subunit RPN8/RPN11
VRKLVSITEEAKPNEAAAFLFKDNTIVIRADPENKSPTHFGGIDTQRVYDLIQKYGIPSALFHSHPCDAVPSYTDLMYMSSTIPMWKCAWLIMSDTMNLRAWTIGGNREATPQRGETIYPKEIKVEII